MRLNGLLWRRKAAKRRNIETLLAAIVAAERKHRDRLEVRLLAQ
jgi:hypothetical protein